MNIKHFILAITALVCASAHTAHAQQWHPDSLGDNFDMRYVDLGTDYSGPVRCTVVRLISQCKTSKRGVLYIHGYNDYFFQREMANNFAEHGYDFYAVDLRKYGRSIMPGQKPFVVRNFRDYFADVDSALNIMRTSECKEIILMGHSTGGLLAAYYMASHPEAPVSALILNSPFLDWNLGAAECFINIASSLGRIFPEIKVSTGGGGVYAESLEKKKHGEWEYDETLKSTNYGVNLGWVRAINKAQHDLRKNFKGKINVPILLLYSARSSNPKSWNPDASLTDVVLDVNDIKRYGRALGPDVTSMSINGGMHDLILSAPDVRQTVYDCIFDWLNKNAK